MVRVAGLMSQLEAPGIESMSIQSIDGRTAAETLAELRPRIVELAHRQDRLWLDELRPALAVEGIVVGDLAQLGRGERAEIEERFQREVFPILTPLAVGPGQPFPYVSGLSLSARLAGSAPGVARVAPRPRQAERGELIDGDEVFDELREMIEERRRSRLPKSVKRLFVLTPEAKNAEEKECLRFTAAIAHYPPPLEDLVDAPFPLQHANHSEHIILNDVVDSHVLETLHCPGAQPGENGIAELFRRSHLRHPAEIFNGVVNRIDESVRCVKSIFQEVVPVLSDDVRFFAAGRMTCLTNSVSGPGVFWRGPWLRP